MTKKLLLILFLGTSLFSSLWADDAKCADYRYSTHNIDDEMYSLLGNYFQVASFIVGPTINTNIVQGKRTGANIGFSTGWNYILNGGNGSDFGLRAKYQNISTSINQNIVGVNLYIHPSTKDNPMMTIPQPISLLLGGGAVFLDSDNKNYTGGYVEAGISVFKYSPINVDFIWRSDFYAKKSNIKPIHSINIVFNIL